MHTCASKHILKIVVLEVCFNPQSLAAVLCVGDMKPHL